LHHCKLSIIDLSYLKITRWLKNQAYFQEISLMKIIKENSYYNV